MAQSDLLIDASKFRPGAVPQAVKDYNDIIRKQTLENPKWWEVGAEKYRQMRLNGETPLPKPVVLDGTSFVIQSRDGDRQIPCRLMEPDSGRWKTVIMHIHGGGWVLQSEKSYDPLLKTYANGIDGGALVISIGYRLAPEHPFPAALHDCHDAVDWLADNAEKHLGAPLQFITGDSAGGHLTMVTFLHLAKSRPSNQLRGLVSVYGCFDLSRTPSVWQLKDNLILTRETYEQFIKAACPGLSFEQLKDPSISPVYASLQGLTLPPHLLVCGTCDILQDDTAFMGAKYQMAGGETIVKWYPGAPHGFISFPGDKMPPAKEALGEILGFFNQKSK